MVGAIVGFLVFLFFGLGGLAFAAVGVKGMVTRELQMTSEDGVTTTLTGLSAVLAGSGFLALGVGLALMGVAATLN